LHGCLAGQFPSRTLVTIAGNGSIDRIGEIAACLAARLPGDPAGTDRTARPGSALAKVRTSSQAEVLAYIDAGPSTALSALLPLVAPAWLLPAASRSCPAHSPGTAGTAHTRRTPSHEY
jgi:hypothetical protein